VAAFALGSSQKQRTKEQGQPEKYHQEGNALATLCFISLSSCPVWLFFAPRVLILLACPPTRGNAPCLMSLTSSHESPAHTPNTHVGLLLFLGGDGGDGWVSGVIDQWMDGWIGWMDGWMDGLDGWMDWMDGWDGWMDGMNGMDRWMDG
jgi:hypothetical protein